MFEDLFLISQFLSNTIWDSNVYLFIYFFFIFLFFFFLFFFRILTPKNRALFFTKHEHSRTFLRKKKVRKHLTLLGMLFDHIIICLRFLVVLFLLFPRKIEVSKAFYDVRSTYSIAILTAWYPLLTADCLNHGSH